MIDVGVGVLLVIALAVAIGAFVQSVVGLGLGLVAAPVITLVAPELMPGGMLMIVLLLPMLTLAADRQDIDWHGLRWALFARIFGTVGGVAVVATFSDRQLGVVIGAMVLAAVLATMRTIVVPITRRSLTVAGFTAGITGTASSIGGPPLALLYQRKPAAQIRSTLAVFFIAGGALSLTGLAIARELTLQELWVALLMAPAQILGFAVSGRLRRRLDPDVVRPLVLGVCALSAVVLIVRSLLA